MGRPDAAGGEDVRIAVAESVHRGDDLVLDIRDHPHLAEIDADIGEVLGDITDVLVLGPAGEYLVADDEKRGGDDSARFRRRARRCLHGKRPLPFPPGVFFEPAQRPGA